MMQKKKFAMIVGSILLILVVALVIFNRVSAADPKYAIGAGDAGKSFTLTQGVTMTVTLDGNPTTGYNWWMQSMDPPLLKQVGEPAYNPNSSAMGAPGKVTLTFEAVKTGQANLTLNYMRSFEKNEPPLNTFEVTVTVK